MPKFGDYFVVEYRIPIKVEGVSTIYEAMSRASKIFQKQHGMKPDNWYARVFKYQTGEKEIGHVEEYFYNPYSSTYREITKNLDYHRMLIEKGLVPEDVTQYEKEAEMLDNESPDVFIKIEDYNE
jgi:hypothetical protein